MTTTKKYPAKLLLFGEYTIIQGSRALAIPLHQYGGQWKQSPNKIADQSLQLGLPILLSYIQSTKEKNQLQEVDTTAFAKALNNGDFFDSNIPQGYGLGSSGSLTAAVYDRFANAGQTENLNQLKQTLATIESCFHGSSSGADALVCYLNQSVLFHSKTELEVVGVDEKQQEHLFLVDTGRARQTAPLVQLFLEKCKDDIYQNRLLAELIPLVDDAIIAFLKNNPTRLFELVHQISYFQFKYFSEMIPSTFKTIWLDCLSSDHSKLKLCGAGGGGCILGFTTNPSKTKALLKDQNLIFINEPNAPGFR